MSQFWNDRYSLEGFAFGETPNDFLVETMKTLPLKQGKVLCLADGEGRNGVYLAELGFEVTSIDLSPVGLEKAQKLAQSRGVEIETILADLAEYEFEPDSYDAIISIFAHFPSEHRTSIHSNLTPALTDGGYLILEAYTPDNVGRGVGGPPTVDSAFTAEQLKQDFSELQTLSCREIEREIHEGQFHNGWSAVVQMIASKK